jgi:hypothetical protein
MSRFLPRSPRYCSYIPELHNSYSNVGIGIQKTGMDGLFQSVAKRFNPLRCAAMRFKTW